VHPAEVLDQVATLLERSLAPAYKVQAFRRAADTIRDRPVEQLEQLAKAGRLLSLSGVGTSTSRVIAEVLEGKTPKYLTNLEAEAAPDAGAGGEIRTALRGDLHSHSDWSDGGASSWLSPATTSSCLRSRSAVSPRAIFSDGEWSVSAR